MQDIGGLIGGVVAFMGAVGAGIAWLVRRRDSKKDPIPKESAAVALANQSVSLMQGVANEIRTDLATVRNEVGELRDEVEGLRTTLSAAARYIERLLRWAKSESRPPLPPLPNALHDLIDPSLHD